MAHYELQKDLACITATYPNGETARLYGYPVHKGGEVVGIITKSCGVWSAYVLDSGAVVSYYSFRTRKDALASYEGE